MKTGDRFLVIVNGDEFRVRARSVAAAAQSALSKHKPPITPTVWNIRVHRLTPAQRLVTLPGSSASRIGKIRLRTNSKGRR